MLLSVRIATGLLLASFLSCPLAHAAEPPAQADEKGALEIFADARRDPYSASGRGRMERAIALLGKDGSVASIRALGEFLQRTFADEVQLSAEVDEIKKIGRVAHDDNLRISRELSHLKQRERAGATGLGPQIAKREDRMQSNAAALNNAKSQTVRVDRVFGVVRNHRVHGAKACIAILGRLDAEAFSRAVASMRSTLVVDKRGPSLLLVHALRRSKRVEGSAALLEIFSHPKTVDSVRIEAACAIAILGDKASMRELVTRLIRNKNVNPKRPLHALSRAAGKKLATLEEAKTWLAASD